MRSGVFVFFFFLCGTSFCCWFEENRKDTHLLSLFVILLLFSGGGGWEHPKKPHEAGAFGLLLWMDEIHFAPVGRWFLPVFIGLYEFHQFHP